TEIAGRLETDGSEKEWKLKVGIGVDRQSVFVRRLGLRGTKENEVWAGKPVSMAAGLSASTGENEILISDRVYGQILSANHTRRRCLSRTCGCQTAASVAGAGFDASESDTVALWTEEVVPTDSNFDFALQYRLKSKWCAIHGEDFCEAIITGKR